MAELIKNVEHASIFTLKDLVEIEPGRVNSLTLSQTPGCKMTVFAIDADEGMSSHAASGDALITVLEGTGEITVNDVPHQLSAGQSIRHDLGKPAQRARRYPVQNAAYGGEARRRAKAGQTCLKFGPRSRA